MIRLESPWSLLVLLFFVFVLPRLRTFPRASAIRRGGAWFCLGLALSGPMLVWGGAREAVVILLDRSASTSRVLGPALGRLRGAVAALPDSVSVTVAVVGATPVIVQPATGGDRVLSGLDRANSESEEILLGAERHETDLEAGLRLAGWTLPASGPGRVLLVTDGWETRGDARRAAADLALRGVAVDTLELNGLEGNVVDASVDAIEAPAQVRVDTVFEIRATVRSTAARPGVVTLLRDGVTLGRRNVRLVPGDTPVRFTSTVPVPGDHRYGIRVSIEGDEESRNDLAEAPVAVVGRPRALWVGPQVEAGLLDALDVVYLHRAGPSETAPRLEDFDAIVLGNIEASDLPRGLMERLPDYVGRFGGGLLMLGDARSFGPGGYRRTPVEEVLPVEMDAGTRAQRPRLALVLVLDKSGSMAEPLDGDSKIAAARGAALATGRLLEPGDRLGIVAFDAVTTVALELDDVVAVRLTEALERLSAGGGTRIFPALAEAGRMVTRLAGWRRHIVLLTDGRGEGGDIAHVARDLAARGITVSAVAVGNDADTVLLRDLALAGGGRFETAGSVERLASMLRREVAMARGPLVHEEPTAVVADRHPVLGDVASEQIPPLLGYVAVTPRRAAVVPLRTAGGDAILALGTFGLGRSAALATDPAGRWGVQWRSWPGRSRLLENLVRWLARAPVASRVTLREAARREGWWLEVDLEDAAGNPLNGRTLVARLKDEGGSEASVPLEQRSIGMYAGPLRSRATRATSVVLDERAGNTARLVGQGWLGLGYPDEYRVRGPNRQLLEDLRQMSGGRPIDARGFADALRPAGRRSVRLWPALALCGLGLFLLDLILSRSGRAPRAG